MNKEPKLTLDPMKLFAKMHKAMMGHLWNEKASYLLFWDILRIYMNVNVYLITKDIELDTYYL